VLSIFINEKPICLGSSEEIHHIDGFESVEYNKKNSFLLTYIEAFENKTFEGERLLIHASNLKELLKDFFDFYKIIEAAGGLVLNERQEILAIYRLGVWDLPKGKVEKGETLDAAAVREVQEETGLDVIELKEPLIDTYHTYIDPRKNRRVLKISHWFLMQTKENELVPQREEDIELAVWLPLQELKNKKVIYKNILEVIKAYEG